MSNMSKKFSATGRNILLIASAMMVSSTPYASHAKNINCSQDGNQKISVHLKENLQAHLLISFCGNHDGKGKVNTEVFLNKKKVQTLVSNYESSAYTIDTDSSIDLNGDGIPDLGISDGKGKDGDGMNYWIFEPRNNRYVDLGEAPALQRSKDGRNTLFSLVTSSGEMQTVRYNYVVSNDSLKEMEAIGFIPSGDAYKVIYLKSNKNGSYNKIGKPHATNSAQAEGCMDGSLSCNF